MKKLTALFKTSLIAGALCTFGFSAVADITIFCERSAASCVTVVDGDDIPIVTVHGDVLGIVFH